MNNFYVEQFFKEWIRLRDSCNTIDSDDYRKLIKNELNEYAKAFGKLDIYIQGEICYMISENQKREAL